MNRISDTYESAMKAPIGGGTVYHGCTGNCRQGRDCPARQACELPEDFLKKDNALTASIRWFALGIALWAGIFAVCYFAAAALGWLPRN